MEVTCAATEQGGVWTADSYLAKGSVSRSAPFLAPTGLSPASDTIGQVVSTFVQASVLCGTEQNPGTQPPILLWCPLPPHSYTGVTAASICLGQVWKTWLCQVAHLLTPHWPCKVQLCMDEF
jgi:hypothetical protein